MKLRNVPIKYNTLFFVLIFIIPIFIYMFTWNYHHFKKEILIESDYRTDKTRYTLLTTFKSTEKNYELVSDYYSSIMTKALYEYEKEYNNNKNIDDINLVRLKKDYNNLLDFYIIDNKGVIVKSTFPIVLGLDFKESPLFYEKLTEVRLSDKIQISKLSTELRTNELRKWGYLPTKDHKYILEVGISSKEIKKNSIGFDYKKLASETLTENQYITKLNIYDIHHISLNSMKKSMDIDLNKSLNNSFNKKVSTTLKNKDGLIIEEFLFIDTFSSFLGDTSKVIHIKYDYTKLYNKIQDSFMRLVLMSTVYLILVLIAIFYTTSFLVSNPLIGFTNHVKDFNNKDKFSSYDIFGDNEIVKLANSFAKLSLDLNTNYTSKNTLKSVIDSIGELFIIFDKDLNIEFINKYGLLSLGYSQTDLSLLKGYPIFFILPNLTKSKIKTLIEKNDRAEDLETNLSTSTGELILSSTFTPVKDTFGTIKGYTCIGKDITEIKIKFSKDENTYIKLLKRNNKDWLTGFYNKNFILQTLDEKIQSEKRVSILIFDIDNFKRINDNFGHPIGDRVLIELSYIIRTHINNSEIIGRDKGDKFIIVSLNKNTDELHKVFKTIQKYVMNHLFTIEEISLTISGSIVDNQQIKNSKELLELARNRLSKAKKNNKNQNIIK